MGFFSKIKDNLGHGGVNIDFQAPASVSMNDANLPVNVTLTASNQQQINKVTAEIIATTHDQAFNTGSPENGTANESHTVAVAEIAQPFALAAGETKTVQLNIVMNSGS